MTAKTTAEHRGSAARERASGNSTIYLLPGGAGEGGYPGGGG